jgi:dCTP deaminase
MATRPIAGTLTDDDIERLCAKSILIEDHFDPKRIRQCCYELRASTIAFETMSPHEDKRVVVPSSGYVLRPRSFVTLITMESLNLPADVVARVLTKGQLFSVGLLPVNTYADPGFRGQLGITFYNASPRHLILRTGEPIAKIEFTVLPKPVARPYAGQHGFATGIWPMPTHIYAKPSDLKIAQIDPASDSEIERVYGTVLADLKNKVTYYERKVWLQLFVTLALFAAILALHNRLDLVQSIGVGIVSNILTTFTPMVIRRRMMARAVVSMI